MDSRNSQPSQSRGDKRSSWATFRRRLILVRRLLQGPASVQELVQAAEAEQGADAYPAAAALAVKHDLQALRDEFGCQIGFQRRRSAYVLEDLGELALLDVPDESLEALGLIDATFPDDAPLSGNSHVRELLARIVAVLPAARRHILDSRLHLPRVVWPAAYNEQLHPRTLTVIQHAITKQHLVVFDYRSNYDADGLARSYQVAPYLLYIREGHTYLDASVIRAPADLPQLHLKAIQFRLDRITPGSARVLPDNLPPERPPVPVYQLVYELAPAVARNRDVSHWFAETTVFYREDGSALITARTTNLWQARQILMRYMEHCRVLEPADLVEMMRQTTAAMAAMYSRSPGDQGEACGGTEQNSPDGL